MAEKSVVHKGARLKPIRTTKWRGEGNLPKKEFRVMIIKMIQDLGKRMETQIEKMQEMFNKDPEELKNKQTEMKNTITEMKNTL